MKHFAGAGLAAAILLSASGADRGAAGAADGAQDAAAAPGVADGAQDGAGATVAALPTDLLAPRMIRARVLRELSLEGVTYPADAVVDVPLETAKSLWEQGAIDPDPRAVAYAESLAAPPAEPVLEG